MYAEGIENNDRLWVLIRTPEGKWPWSWVPVGTYAIRDGKLLDHDLLFENADDLLAWLGHVKSGVFPMDYIKSRAGERNEDSEPVVRMIYADRLERWGNDDKVAREKAADEYTWVYEQVRTPREPVPMPVVQRGTTLSKPPFHMIRYDTYEYGVDERVRMYAKDFPAVRDRVAVIRDLLREEILKMDRPSEYTVHDWLYACSIAPDPKSTVAVYKALQGKAKAIADQALLNFVVTLEQGGAWAEAGAIIDQPMIRVHREFDRIIMMGAMDMMGTGELKKDDPAMYRRMYAQTVGVAAAMHAALLAAGRDQEAFDVGATVLELTNDDWMTKGVMVMQALKAKQARPEHLAWAKAADSSPERAADLPLQVPQVEELLRGKAK
jgi:hypothetical protein